MNMLMVGGCTPDSRFELVDPTAPNETEFVNDVAKALMCYRIGYRCIPFSGTVEFEERRFRPDLALVAPDWSHWFVIEVELVAHSLNHHVLPQVRAFRFGEWQDDSVSGLTRGLKISVGQAQQLLLHVPRAVVVVANKRLPEWEASLRPLDVQLLTVSIFKSRQGVGAYAVDGALEVARESLGFGVFAATDSAIRVASSMKIPDGEIQIDDSRGTVSRWMVRRDGATAWISKVYGLSEIDDAEHVQLLKTMDGRISLRRFDRHK